MSKRFIDFIKNPALVFESLGARGFFKKMSDEKYLKKLFRIKMGKKPDLVSPKTYSEKLQWLKLHDRKPEYSLLVDKAEVKKLVAEKIGEEHIIPTLGVYEKWDDIDFDKLPKSFVIKCTHDSGGLVIVKDKSAFDKKSAEKKIKKSLKRNFYYASREWPYKNVIPRIIVEKYLDGGKDLPDYKFFCFDGKVKALFVATGRPYDTRFDFYDENYNFLPFTNGHPNSDVKLEKPENFEKMKEIAEILSKGYPHVRIDLYDLNGKIYFGEYTFYHWSGLTPFCPEEWDYKFGDMIKLPDGEKI